MSSAEEDGFESVEEIEKVEGSESEEEDESEDNGDAPKFVTSYKSDGEEEEDDDDDDMDDDDVVTDMDRLQRIRDGTDKKRVHEEIVEEDLDMEEDTGMNEGSTGGIPRKYQLVKDLTGLMYASGDIETPYLESVHVLEDMVMDFLVQMTRQTATYAVGRDRIKESDVLLALRERARLKARAEELLFMYAEVKRLKKKTSNPKDDLATKKNSVKRPRKR